jgi:hypothetical protein
VDSRRWSEKGKTDMATRNRMALVHACFDLDGGGSWVGVSHKQKWPRLRFCYFALIDPLKPTHVRIIFKNSARTSKRTQLVTITNINLLTLFKEIIAVYTENHTELLIVKRLVYINTIRL